MIIKFNSYGIKPPFISCKFFCSLFRIQLSVTNWCMQFVSGPAFVIFFHKRFYVQRSIHFLLVMHYKRYDSSPRSNCQLQYSSNIYKLNLIYNVLLTSSFLLRVSFLSLSTFHDFPTISNTVCRKHKKAKVNKQKTRCTEYCRLDFKFISQAH